MKEYLWIIVIIQNTHPEADRVETVMSMSHREYAEISLTEISGTVDEHDTVFFKSPAECLKGLTDLAFVGPSSLEFQNSFAYLETYTDYSRSKVYGQSFCVPIQKSNVESE